MNKIIFSLLLISNITIAMESNDRDNLIEGCKQLATLYENQKDQRFISEFIMSPSDTLLAGYCRGMVQAFVEYSSNRLVPCGYNNSRYCEESICSESDWYIIANKISQYQLEEDTSDMYGYFNIEKILISGCQ